MEHLPFSGITALDENDPITVDGASFLIKNPRLTDHLLQIGAVTHRHDQHTTIPNPHVGPLATVIPSAGTIAASTTLAFTYTVMDNANGETAPAPPVTFVTGGQVNPPTITPSATIVSSAGIMPAGNYYYAETYTDGEGGETSLGPPILVTVPPGLPSASVLLAGLASELAVNGPVNWRLWRSYEGADWHLVTQNLTNTFVDAGFDPPDDPARPPENNTTAGTFSVAVTLPTLAQEPAFGSGTAINLYLAPDDTFSDPCFLMRVPIASAGHTILITDEAVTEGSPPSVTTCVPGAHQIFPDTELVWGVKSPVDTAASLPASASVGDIRMANDTHLLWGFTASGWVEVGAAGTWKSPVPVPSALPLSPLNSPGDARATLSTDQIWLWSKGNGFDFDYVPLDAIENQVTDGNPNPIANAGSGWVTDTATDDQYIYWTWSELTAAGSGRIGRVRIDGSGANPFWVAQNNASGITNPGGLDTDSQYVYFANNNRVGRVNKDGTGLNGSFVVNGQLGAVKSVAVDDTYLYIASFINGIWRCNKSDGSGLISLHAPPTAPPPGFDTLAVMDITVDDTYVYWAMQFELINPGVGGSGIVFSDAGIGRCKKDGTGVQSPWVVTAPGGTGGFPWSIVVTGGGIFFGHGQEQYPDSHTEQLPAIGFVNVDGNGLKKNFIPTPFASGSVQALSFGANDFFFSMGTMNEPFRVQHGIDGISSYNLGEWDVAKAAIIASGGTGSATVASVLEFVGSAGATVQVADRGGGSALVTITAGTGATGSQGSQGVQGPPGAGAGIGGSGKVPLISPVGYVEFVGSGVGTGVAVSSTGGGSAQVLVGAAAVAPKATQASGYTFAASDPGTVVESASAGAGSASVGYIIAPFSQTPIPLDSVIEVFQYGTGQVQICPGAGVSVRSDGGKTKTAAQFATIGLRQRATNEWVLSGDLA